MIVFGLLGLDALAAEPGTILWETPLAGEILAAPALGHDGSIYVNSTARRLYALDSAGETKWAFPTRVPSNSSPAVGRNGTVYTAGGYLYAVSPEGRELWRHPHAGSFTPPALSADGSLYVPSDKRIERLDASGQIIWTYPAVYEVVGVASPAILSDGTICTLTNYANPFPGGWYYIGFVGPRLVGLGPDGDARWLGTALEGHFPMTPSGRGKLYFPARQGRVWETDVPRLGEFETPLTNSFPGGLFPYDYFPPIDFPDPEGPFYPLDPATLSSPPVLGHSGTIYSGTGISTEPSGRRYFFSGTGYFYAIKPDGWLKWRLEVEGAVSGAAVDAHENVYLGTSKGKFYAVDAEGSVRWQLDLGAGVGSPMLSPDAVVYVGTQDGRVVAIQAEAGPDSSPWPQFQRNPQHTGSLETYLTLEHAGDIVLHGIPGRTYRIDWTADLTGGAWKTLTTFTLTGDSETFRDATPDRPILRYYRAELLPP